MECPKCESPMDEEDIRTLQGLVTIDQCTECKGFWFDTGEAEKLKDTFRTDFLDSGDPDVGKQMNEKRDINCPRCEKPLRLRTDPKQKHIQLETCDEHGVFMDAGEFRDYKNETLMDVFRGVVAIIKGA